MFVVFVPSVKILKNKNSKNMKIFYFVWRIYAISLFLIYITDSGTVKLILIIQHIDFSIYFMKFSHDVSLICLYYIEIL